MANEIIKLGMYIGVGGVITFKNAKNLPEVVYNTPLDRILLETDAPYLAPVPFRSKRNDSSLITYIAEKIGELIQDGDTIMLDASTTALFTVKSIFNKWTKIHHLNYTIKKNHIATEK